MRYSVNVCLCKQKCIQVHYIQNLGIILKYTYMFCLINYVNKKKKILKFNVYHCFILLFISGLDTYDNINNKSPHYAIAGTIKLILAFLSPFLFSWISHTIADTVVTHCTHTHTCKRTKTHS